MALTQLDETQKLSLRNRAKDELVRIETLIADKAKKRMIDDFKEKFSVCEIVYKVILEGHQFTEEQLAKKPTFVDFVLITKKESEFINRRKKDCRMLTMV